MKSNRWQEAAAREKTGILEDPCKAGAGLMQASLPRRRVSHSGDESRIPAEAPPSGSDNSGCACLNQAMVFEIHPRLAAGGHEIGRLDGCRLLLKDNALFPWFLLVPEVEGVEDLHQLPSGRYDEVMSAMRRVSEFVASYFQPEKLNVACIGNQVRQMHIHVVGRSTGDPAWPGTVWAFEGKNPYAPEEIIEIRTAASRFLKLP